MNQFFSAFGDIGVGAMTLIVLAFDLFGLRSLGTTGIATALAQAESAYIDARVWAARITARGVVALMRAAAVLMLAFIPLVAWVKSETTLAKDARDDVALAVYVLCAVAGAVVIIMRSTQLERTTRIRPPIGWEDPTTGATVPVGTPGAVPTPDPADRPLRHSQLQLLGETALIALALDVLIFVIAVFAESRWLVAITAMHSLIFYSITRVGTGIIGWIYVQVARASESAAGLAAQLLAALPGITREDVRPYLRNFEITDEGFWNAFVNEIPEQIQDALMLYGIAMIVIGPDTFWAPLMALTFIGVGWYTWRSARDPYLAPQVRERRRSVMEFLLSWGGLLILVFAGGWQLVTRVFSEQVSEGAQGQEAASKNLLSEILHGEARFGRGWDWWIGILVFLMCAFVAYLLFRYAGSENGTPRRRAFAGVTAAVAGLLGFWLMVNSFGGWGKEWHENGIGLPRVSRKVATVAKEPVQTSKLLPQTPYVAPAPSTPSLKTPEPSMEMTKVRRRATRREPEVVIVEPAPMTPKQAELHRKAEEIRKRWDAEN